MADEDDLERARAIDPGEAIRAAREKGEAIEAEFEREIAEFERRTDEARARRGRAEAKILRARAGAGESARGLGLGFAIGYAILGLPLLGYGVGWLLDRRFETTTIAGFGMLIGATLGVVFAVLQLNRAQR